MSEAPGSGPATPPEPRGPAGEPSAPSSPSPRLARAFRWQAFFQHSRDPVFVLNRRCRLLFVNRAWEALTGLDVAAAALLVCRPGGPMATELSSEERIAQSLAPPDEVWQGTSSRSRRLVAGLPAGTSWWEVEHLPLAQEGKQGSFLILGRIRVVGSEPASAPAEPFLELAPLLQQARERLARHYWASPLASMRRLMAQARLAAGVAAPVLLVGEAGTGKRTLAHTIHAQARERELSFAALSCSYLPAAAVAAVLFGEREGASPPPRLGGIYLADPGALPRDLQLRLAAWLSQEGEGTNRPRIYAGCPRPLVEEVRAGRLLEELACALGLLVLEVPPLRERRADLPALVARMLERANEEGDRQVLELSPEAWELLRAHDWPANLRELFAVLSGARRRAAGDRIEAADLPITLRRSREEIPLRPVERMMPLDRLLEEMERRLIEVALRRSGGHKARAAELLSIWRGRLSRRIETLGIEGGTEPSAE